MIRPPEIDWETFTIACVPANPEPFRRINRIPIRDNGETLVDLRETNPELSFGVHCLPYVRESVAKALKVASLRTPEHLDLRVFTALRTLEQQAEMYWHNYNRAKEQHPDWPESVVRRVTNRFFAPPDAKAPPGHCTGAAVDVGLLLRDTGEGIDVRSPLEGWKGAPTAVVGLHPEAAENRRLLCYIMHSTGLSNCRDEFWHWSYGDSAWAVRVGATEACYGHVSPPPDATRVTGPKLEIHPYSEDWPNQFEELKAVIEPACQEHLISIEHLGSTSVPGLSAKPIIDLIIVVPDQPSMERLIGCLAELGYHHDGDKGVPGREAFGSDSEEVPKTDPGRKWPTHHLYAAVEGATELRRMLAFRDFLRAHPRSVEEYAAVKARLAARFPWDRIRYTDAKGPFVTEILRQSDPSLL